MTTVRTVGHGTLSAEEFALAARFADEWDAERDAGYPTLARLKEQHTGPAVREYEAELRRRLGPNAVTQ